MNRIIKFVLAACTINALSLCSIIIAQSLRTNDQNKQATADTLLDNSADISLSKDSELRAINPVKTPEISTTRLAAVAGVAAASLTVVYIRLRTAWWNDGSGKFHFQSDPDYALNIDKPGHFWGSMVLSDGFKAGLQWAGLEEKRALLYGAGLSMICYLGIEVKDGFSRRWGFSPGDIASDLLGSFYPFLQNEIPMLQNFKFKWSYWPGKEPYYDRLGFNSDKLFSDDYEGQTFWLSLKVHSFLPDKLKPYWPKFISIAGGVAVEKLDGIGGGNMIILAAPDLDLEELLPGDGSFWKQVKHFLNYLHLPTPAVRLSPGIVWYGLYFRP